MNEKEFLSFLEYRICGELSRVRPAAAPSLWCDGLTLHSQAANPGQRLGTAWISGLPGQHPARDQESWSFRLTIGEGEPSLATNDWEQLLPPEGAVGWLWIDLDKREVHVELPASASR